MFTASVVASGTGTVSASIFPPLRTSLSVNDVVEIAAPKIEGHVLPGEELSWQLALDHTTDRKSVVKGKSVSVSVDLGGRRIIKKNTHKRKNKEQKGK